MALSLEEKRAIVNYRIQKAQNTMIEAKDNANLKHWNLVANRLYYAVFHMASALLIDKGFTAKSHNGIFCILGQEFVAKGVHYHNKNPLHNEVDFCYPVRNIGE